MKRIGILYEHPEWFRPLFAELDRRGVPFERIHAARHTFDPSERSSPYALVVNRMSPSAWWRGHREAVFYTLHYLAYLDDVGTTVLNGYRAFRVEVSKARQIRLFARLGVRHPRTRVISRPSQALEAAQALRFPVMVKPNVGGSGAGIRVFASPAELARVAAEASLDLGPDRTGLVQEYLPAEGDSIVRIEILAGAFLYAIRLRLVPGTFNLCPADYCELPSVADDASARGRPVEAYAPPRHVVDDVKRIVAAAGLDLGGVEYLVSRRDGLPYFYDVNALSNFVADAPNLLGFDPHVHLVDLILKRAGIGSHRGLRPPADGWRAGTGPTLRYAIQRWLGRKTWWNASPPRLW